MLIYFSQHLDEDVRRERNLVLGNNEITQSSVILVRDLAKRFEKKKGKSKEKRVYYAVDHLNFLVQRRACFGLLGTTFYHSKRRCYCFSRLGANGAGKTTTFRMLINDIKPSAGDIIINGKNINQSVCFGRLGDSEIYRFLLCSNVIWKSAFVHSSIG